MDGRRSLVELSLEAETSVPDGEHPDLQKRLEQSFENSLHLRVPVRLRPLGFLPRFEMKAHRWIGLKG